MIQAPWSYTRFTPSVGQSVDDRECVRERSHTCKGYDSFAVIHAPYLDWPAWLAAHWRVLPSVNGLHCSRNYCRAGARFITLKVVRASGLSNS